MTHRFRVWDGKQMHLPPHQFMLGNELCKRSSEIGIHEGLYTYTLSSMHHAEVMFYTGLDDAEGTEIYEGDIVESIYDVRYEIVWNETWGRFDVYRLGSGIGDWAHAVMAGLTVIGNRFQTPELRDD